MIRNPFISVISPVYGAAEIITELVSEIEKGLKNVTDHYEIILVEDNSPDDSWNRIVEIARDNKNVKGVKFSRNFGQHNAITAGLEIAKGDYVVPIDCDLQHDPIYIKDLYAKITEGYDLVYARIITRKHSFIKNLTARFYYRLLQVISDFDMDPNIGSYSMLSRKVVDAFNRYDDYKKTYLWALKWVGFKHGIVDIEHSNRLSGKSSYSIRKLLSHALNVTVANSDKLLYLSVYVGIVTSILSFIGVIYIIYLYYASGSLEGWSSLIVTIMFFSGLILTFIGIIAVYIAKIYEQTKGRPRYIIMEKVNFDD